MEHVPETDEQARARVIGATCGSCLYATASRDTIECRFKPPAIAGYKFPTVHLDDWCGEFVARKAR